MRSALKRIRDRVHLDFHPADGVLLGAVDGQLSPKATSRVKAHLARCATCRNRLEELQEGLRFYDRCIAPKEPEIAISDCFRPLAAGADDGKVVFGDQEERPSLVAYARMQSELSIYVGHQAARQLLDRCDRPAIRRDRLRSVIQPVITELFGERTGTAVVDSLIRTWYRTQVEVR